MPVSILGASCAGRVLPVLSRNDSAAARHPAIRTAPHPLRSCTHVCRAVVRIRGYCFIFPFASNAAPASNPSSLAPAVQGPHPTAELHLQEPFVIERLEAASKTYEELSKRMGDPEVAADPDEFQRIARQAADLAVRLLCRQLESANCR